MWSDLARAFFGLSVITFVFGILMVGIPIGVSRIYDARDREMSEILEGVMEGVWTVAPWVMLCAITQLIMFALTGTIAWAVE